MIIYPSSKRTKTLLRVRRLLTALQRRTRPEWPEQAIDQLVTHDMLMFARLPASKLRRVLAHIENA